MKRIIVMVVSMTILLWAPAAMVHGSGSHRANLDRIWKKQQAYQQRMDQKLDKIQTDAERDRSPMCGTSGQRTWSRVPGRLKP